MSRQGIPSLLHGREARHTHITSSSRDSEGRRKLFSESGSRPISEDCGASGRELRRASGAWVVRHQCSTSPTRFEQPCTMLTALRNLFSTGTSAVEPTLPANASQPEVCDHHYYHCSFSEGEQPAMLADASVECTNGSVPSDSTRPWALVSSSCSDNL